MTDARNDVAAACASAVLARHEQFPTSAGDVLALMTEAATEALRSPPRRKLIQIGNNAHIAHDMVASLEWRRPTYANSAGTATLIITLKDGRVFNVEHRPHGYGGADAYAIERELIDAN